MNRQEMLDEYKKRLVDVRRKLVEGQAAENQLLGAIHVLEELGKDAPPVKRSNLADANGQFPELPACIPD